MRKRLIAFLLILAAGLLLPPSRAEGEGPVTIHAASAVVMSGTGDVIFDFKGDTRRLIASTTKLMTALVTLEHASPEETVPIPPACAAVEGSSMYLKAGAVYTVRELLEGLLLASGNDAALALACHVAGSAEDFAALMNEKARALGMTGSHFANPHGLDDPAHYGTARDLAVLMAACLENDTLASLLAERSAVVGEQTYINHNKLLSLCPGCLGGKTGYTEAAGRCLVSCCEREGTRLICVTLGDPDDWADHQELYNWAFARYSTRRVSESLSFSVPVLGGQAERIRVGAEEAAFFLPRSAEVTLVAHLPRFVFAPVQEGEAAGRAEVFCNGEKIGEMALFYAETVEEAA